jgi:hypothetical protein
MRETFCETVDALQADRDNWLLHDTTERPHLGYRNQGRRPIETVMSFVSQDGAVDTWVIPGHFGSDMTLSATGALADKL